MALEKRTGITVWMAVVDALPVLLFGGSCLLLGERFKSALFLLGACSCLAAGIGKVVWKLLLAIQNLNISWLNRQFRYVLPFGFLCMLLAVIFNYKRISIGGILHAVTSFPASIFWVIGAIGFLLMGVLAWKLDGSVQANWIEQVINTITQLSFFVAILLCVNAF